MALSGFHPLTSRWFEDRFEAPTPAQARGWSAIRRGDHALIAAPTGSGKTLAAFLHALDELLCEGLDQGELPDETRVLYVSPLKALSADIHKNLAEPRREMRALAKAAGAEAPRITAAVRTGDTPQSARAAMLRKPPHILVTTPESLYLLLTSERSREMLRTVRTVIVDEIHAVIESRRGAHLALSLERLDHVTDGPLQRVGLSATQKPIERVGRFLMGAAPGDLEIIDEGHRRALDLAIELPSSPLEAVMSAEVWLEVYERVEQLIAEHRTTLIFVNTRRLAERMAHNLAERLGSEEVATHHGSLSKEVRLEAESRLKSGQLKVLVATASLELGIDIGHVDLVIQIGSPRRVSTLLQRVGRSGHTVRGTPKGRVFPLTRDELVECVALLGLVRAGELDSLVPQIAPLDVLAQQIAAECAAEEWAEADLFELARGAEPYCSLERDTFDAVVRMLADGFVTRRGRRSALIHRDAVNRRVRGRRGARLRALTSGGAIPELADYRVVLEPEGTFIGTVDEDFAVESMAGDVFQLGNTSWRILRVERGVVRVADAQGEPPGIPFWFGEAPARSDELSAAVAALRAVVGAQLDAEPGPTEDGPVGEGAEARDAGERVDGGDEDPDRARVAAWLAQREVIPVEYAEQLVRYFAESKRLLGALPTQRTIVLERFFDDSGGMQLVLHAPFGARVNRAWGLALRKKFCRTFNFELQAAATDDGVLLSLGPQHSFPLDDVFRFLRPETVRATLVQAVLDSPLFQTRWRWVTTLSLAVPRFRNGRKVAPQLQRMQAEDLLAAAFPDAAACLENIAGDRDVPDHPLVTQAVRDCLEDAMDLPRLVELLHSVLAGELELVARDTPEPSPLCHELLNARPYAFLDDAPLEERRTQAVYTRRALEPSSARDMGALDPAAIERVRAEARPDPRDADELHDALLGGGYMPAQTEWRAWFETLVERGRATAVLPAGTVDEQHAGLGVVNSHESVVPIAEPVDRRVLWVATERVPELRAVLVDAAFTPEPAVPEEYDVEWACETALREVLRGRLAQVGPTTSGAIATELGLSASTIDAALIALEADGVILRGRFTDGAGTGQSGAETVADDVTEWCDRALLARIHRYTLDRLRAEIRPVTPRDYLRFLTRWQHLDQDTRLSGPDALAEVIAQLDGMELPAASWEEDVLPARCQGYEPEWLDRLCLSGRVGWGRSVAGGTGALTRASPLSLFMRAPSSQRAAAGPPQSGTRAEKAGATQAGTSGAVDPGTPAPDDPIPISTEAAMVREDLEKRGASFFDEIAARTGLLPTRLEQALGELVAAGTVTSDSFAGLRALLTPSSARKSLGGAGRANRRKRVAPYGVDTAGRWSILARPEARPHGSGERSEGVEAWANTLLRRWGVVFRRLLERETGAPSWREIVLTLRRLEARGLVRGGRFIAGLSGEQFALPEAVTKLRSVRRKTTGKELIAVGAADPVNLTGIVTPDRVPAVPAHRLLFQAGLPMAVLGDGELRWLSKESDLSERDARDAIVRPAVAPTLRPYLRRAAGRRPRGVA